MSDRSSPPHVIRLRFPWSVESLGNGLQRFSRHFNSPTGLANGDRVELVLARVPSPIDVELNGSPLGELDLEGNAVKHSCAEKGRSIVRSSAFRRPVSDEDRINAELRTKNASQRCPEGQIVRFAVTDLLEPRNRVDITMAEPSPQAAGGATEGGGSRIEPPFDANLEIFSLLHIKSRDP